MNLPFFTDPKQSDDAPAVMKLLLVWVSTITGMTVTEWAAVFAIVYTLLQIYVLVRDKIVAPRRAVARASQIDER